MMNFTYMSKYLNGRNKKVSEDDTDKANVFLWEIWKRLRETHRVRVVK
jgi:hypothetical protein